MTRTTLNFDELNELEATRQAQKAIEKAKKSNIPVPIPYRDYFKDMYITPEQMDSRVDLAKQIESVMLYLFAYWVIRADAGLSEKEMRQDAKDKLTEVIAKHTKLDTYLKQHIDNLIDEVVDTTAKHTEDQNQLSDNGADNSDGSDNGADYWTSPERAMLIAENEANSFENYVEYREAKARGCTTKKWLTENDDKVRLSHALSEGQTVDIDGLFLVGDSLMRFPRDSQYDPDPAEVVNCRCACIYE